jgi:hypothetical protein
MNLLAKGKEEDYYYSGISPLGVPFNSIKGVSMSVYRMELAKTGNPGANCSKGFLKYNTEYTEKPICTSSKQYQTLKLKELTGLNLSKEEYQKAYDKIIEKECLCKGLSTSTLMSKNIEVKSDYKVTCCPGPNLAWFSKISTLTEMVDHIYGRINLLDNRPRPHMFLKELNMYLDIFKERVEEFLKDTDNQKEKKLLITFRENLMDGINYYKALFTEKKVEVVADLEKMLQKYPSLNFSF